MPKNKRSTVWSSSQGDLRQKTHASAPVKSIPPNQQTVYLHRESKGRGGKGVSLVKNLVLSEKDIKALAKKLKQPLLVFVAHHQVHLVHVVSN